MWQHENKEEPEPTNTKRSLFRVGSAKYLTNNKCQKGKSYRILIHSNKDILESTEKGNISLRPKLNLRKKSMSVDTEMLFDSERGENKHIHQFGEHF